MRKKPEILSPAGDFEKLRFAVAYGADAVYLAGKSFGMRTASGNFTPDEVVELLSAIEELKSKYIKAVDRGDGKLDFYIGDDVYQTDKSIAV